MEVHLSGRNSKKKLHGKATSNLLTENLVDSNLVAMDSMAEEAGPIKPPPSP